MSRPDERTLPAPFKIEVKDWGVSEVDREGAFLEASQHEIGWPLRWQQSHPRPIECSTFQQAGGFCFLPWCH
jgi:hypothetical protein